MRASSTIEIQTDRKAEDALSVLTNRKSLGKRRRASCAHAHAQRDQGERQNFGPAGHTTDDEWITRKLEREKFQQARVLLPKDEESTHFLNHAGRPRMYRVPVHSTAAPLKCNLA